MRAVKGVVLEGEGSKLSSVMTAPARFLRFLKDVRTELRSVTWPNRDDLRSTTATVIVTTFFFGFYLGVVLDIPMFWFMKGLLDFGKQLVQGQ